MTSCSAVWYSLPQTNQCTGADTAMHSQLELILKQAKCTIAQAGCSVPHCRCCGDMRHFDLSQYAFDKLADSSQGVMGIRFRPVACPP